MTIDDTVDSVSYNGYELQVEGDVKDWQVEKTFEFSSCYNHNLGALLINGTDWNKNKPNGTCFGSGMMLRCTAEDTKSPWHNFTSNVDNWVDNEDNSTLCSNEDNMVTYGLKTNTKIIVDLHEKGAKKIWTTKYESSLRGTPKKGTQSFDFNLLNSTFPKHFLIFLRKL